MPGKYDQGELQPMDREVGMDSDPFLSFPRSVVETAVITARKLLDAKFCVFVNHAHSFDQNQMIVADGVSPSEAGCLVDRWLNSPRQEIFPYRGNQCWDEVLSVRLCFEPVVDLSGRGLGMLLVGFSKNLILQFRKQLLMRTLASHLALLIESYTRQNRSNAQFEALFEIGAQIQAEVNLDKVLRQIVLTACNLLGTETAWLALLREGTDYLYIQVTEGILTSEFSEMYVPIGVGIGGIAVAKKRTVIVPDYRKYKHNTLDFVRDTVVKEGIVSMMCAPMLRRDKLIGALYVGNRRFTQFTPTDVVLLSTLATQASIAIQNAQLYRQQEEALTRLRDLNSLLESKNYLLEQSFAIHKQLTAAVLDGNGIEEVGTIMARLIRRPLAIKQEILPPFLSYYSPDQEGADILSTQIPDSDPRITTPIMAGDEVLGCIIIIGTEKLSDIEQQAVEHGSTVLALELLKQRAARNVEWRLQGELLEELLETKGELTEAQLRRAERMGFDVEQPHYLLIAQLNGFSNNASNHIEELLNTARQTLRDLGPVLGMKRGDRIILAVPSGNFNGTQIARSIQKVWRHSGNPRVFMGISGRISSNRTFATAYREALACLQFARIINEQGAMISYEDLGPLRFLLHVRDPRYAIEFVQQRLGTLAAYDRSHRSALLPTLRAYLESGGHHPTTAEKCFIHPNTLKYRLSRISDLLGISLTDPDIMFELNLAFRILNLFEASGRRIL